MPDLDTVVMAMCLTNVEWERDVRGSRGDIYKVTFGPVDPQLRGVTHDYMCTCPDFGIRRLPEPGAYCKHIRKVQGERCGWDELLHGGKATRTGEDWVCPVCGGPVEFYRAGV